MHGLAPVRSVAAIELCDLLRIAGGASRTCGVRAHAVDGMWAMCGTVTAFPARQANRGGGVRSVGGAHGRCRSRDCRPNGGCAAGIRARAAWSGDRHLRSVSRMKRIDGCGQDRQHGVVRCVRGGIARHRTRIVRAATGRIGLACPVDHYIAADQQHECQDAQDRRGRCARLLERRVAKRARDARRPRVKGVRSMRGIRCAVDRIERPVPPAAGGAVFECMEGCEAAFAAAEAGSAPCFGSRVQDRAPVVARANGAIGEDSHRWKRAGAVNGANVRRSS